MQDEESMVKYISEKLPDLSIEDIEAVLEAEYDYIYESIIKGE